MSFLHNAPWTPSEKVDLLVNVLRSTIPDLPFFLMQVLHEKGIYPKWNDTPLPAGRSLASSQIIYEEMGRAFKPQGTYNVQPIGAPHVTPIAPALPGPGRRSFPDIEPYISQQQHQHQQQQLHQQQQQQQQRTLQPRPPRSTDSPIPVVTNGEMSAAIRPIAMSEPLQEPHRKKRGRPSKEEAEERDRALAAEGKVYQPKKRPAKKVRPSLEGTPGSARTSDAPPFAPQTPPAQTPENKEQGSSGKKRVKRQSREEGAYPGDFVERPPEPPQPEAQSPSDRLLAPHRERDLDILLGREKPTPQTETAPKSEEAES